MNNDEIYSVELSSLYNSSWQLKKKWNLLGSNIQVDSVDVDQNCFANIEYDNSIDILKEKIEVKDRQGNLIFFNIINNIFCAPSRVTEVSLIYDFNESLVCWYC